MTLPATLYYLADRNDLFRLSATGEIMPAHDCRPWYFYTIEAALNHPEALGLQVFPVPTAETLPGAPKGTRIEDAVDAQDAYQAVAAIRS